MPRNKYPEETVQKILQASQKLFFEKGYEETTILDIVAELGGLSRGAFYHHFKSKEEVLDALGDQMFYDNNPFEMVRNQKYLNGLEKLRMVIKLNSENNEQQEINKMSLPLLKNPKIYTTYMQSNEKVLVPFFQELIEEAVNDGSIPSDLDPQALASLLVFLSSMWLTGGLAVEDKDVLLGRLHMAKRVFDNLGVPILDDENMALCIANLEKMIP